MGIRRYDLSECQLYVSKQYSGVFQCIILTKIGEFIASAQLSHVGEHIYVPDGVVARRGFGYSLHRMLVDVATYFGGALAVVRDGDARGNALNVWNVFLNDPELYAIDISKTPCGLYEWTNSIDDPSLFHAYKSKKNKQYIEWSKITFANHIDTTMAKHLQEAYSFFDRAYSNDCNGWIDEEHPLETKINYNNIKQDIHA